MERIVVDVQTGEQTVVQLTPEEEAEILAQAAAQPPQGPTREELEAQIAALQAQLAALP